MQGWCYDNFLRIRKYLCTFKFYIMSTTIKYEPDVVLIGAGIMSATLGVFLKELMPEVTINIYERLDVAAAESSDAWNNAGTGHSAFCELNYTPQLANGAIDTTKAVKIAEWFEVSKQFWAYLVEKWRITNPEDFVVVIKPGPEATYKNTVDILDEMTINDVKRYAMVDIFPTEVDLMHATEKNAGIK